MITHLHVKSGDNSLNGIAAIGQTIFVKNWLWRLPVFLKLLKINTSQAYATLYPHKKFGDDIFMTSFHWSDVVKILSQQNIGCGGHFVFQKFLKINTSQAYATLYPHTQFGDDIFINFPLIDRTSSKFWVSRNWLWRPFCFSEIVENQYQPSLCRLISI